MSGQMTANYVLTSKNTLTIEEMDLFELAELAGIAMDPQVFKIMMDLLKMNVTPTAVLQMLKSMCGARKKKHMPEDATPSSITSKQKSAAAAKPRLPTGTRSTESRR